MAEPLDRKPVAAGRRKRRHAHDVADFLERKTREQMEHDHFALRSGQPLHRTAHVERGPEVDRVGHSDVVNERILAASHCLPEPIDPCQAQNPVQVPSRVPHAEQRRTNAGQFDDGAVHEIFGLGRLTRERDRVPEQRADMPVVELSERGSIAGGQQGQQLAITSLVIWRLHSCTTMTNEPLVFVTNGLNGRDGAEVRKSG
ncbi:MAG: hypothetical protein ABI818_19055, partial [Acidobacteriota bacterium]